jgi:hypothetical protein
MKLVAFLFFPIFSFGQIKLEQKISLIDSKVELFAPKTLTKMSDEMWNFKYQKRARPILVLTDEDAEVNLIADLTKQLGTENQIAAFKDFQMVQLKKSRQDLEFLGDGVKTVNGKKVGYFKFLSQAIDQKVFNYYFFTIVDGKILLFTFNCIEKLRTTWESTADNIIATLKTE